MLKPKKSQSVVGLDIEAGSIAATEVTGQNGSSAVGRTAISPLEPGIVSEGEVQNPAALAEALKSLFTQAKLPKNVRVGVANQRVVVRTLQLPFLEKKEEIETAVQFQAQEQIPMPLDQAVLDHHVVNRTAGSEGERKMEVIAVAARKDMLSVLVHALREAGLNPQGIDLSAFGMIRALHSGAVPEVDDNGQPLNAPATLFCHLGDVTNLAVARGENCLFARVSTLGIETMAELVSDRAGMTIEDARHHLADIGLGAPAGSPVPVAEPVPVGAGVEGGPQEELSLEQESVDGPLMDEPEPADPNAALATEEGAARLADEVRLSLEYYGSQEAAAAVERIVMCGPGATIPGLADRIQVGLGRPVEIRTPHALSDFADEDAARLTVSYGLALGD